MRPSQLVKEYAIMQRVKLDDDRKEIKKKASSDDGQPLGFSMICRGKKDIWSIKWT